MLENPTVLHNGYGIRDPQEHEHIPFKDICGNDVFHDADLLVFPEGECSGAPIVTVLGFQGRRGGV
ncbi:hypothetical protein [Bacillus wiedmannii]|uniref:hypothetical protein n=1 Tax=Bacillus wiedmannii TaxID=1890302 RepID=UPI000BF10EC3|nr:hypothetical protein [Bacillus wiedmannii]PEO37569.1 hypothetical protein CN555_17420 [Bacillus wiedmannii]